MKWIVLLMGLCAFSCCTAKQLLFAADVIRHGARTPTHPAWLDGIDYPAIWSQDNVPYGQLTVTGFLEEMRLGESFRHTYVKQYHLLSPNYRAKQICVRSSGINRTRMSAIAVLTRLYPQSLTTQKPLGIQIDSVPGKQDNLLRPVNINIPAIAQSSLWLKYWRDFNLGAPFYYSLRKQGLAQNKIFFPPHNQLCSPQSTQDSLICLKAIMKLASNVAILSAHCSDPFNHCQTSALLGLDPNTIEKIIAAKNRYLQRDMINSNPALEVYQPLYRQRGRVMACPLVSEIIQNMRRKIENPKNSYRYILYSGHSETVLPTMNYLMSFHPTSYQHGYPMTSEPGFGADIQFLLFENAQHHYRVKVTYADNYQHVNRPRLVFSGSLKEFAKIYYAKNCLQRITAKNTCDFKCEFRAQ